MRMLTIKFHAKTTVCDHMLKSNNPKRCIKSYSLPIIPLRDKKWLEVSFCIIHNTKAHFQPSHLVYIYKKTVNI